MLLGNNCLVCGFDLSLFSEDVLYRLCSFGGTSVVQSSEVLNISEVENNSSMVKPIGEHGLYLGEYIIEGFTASPYTTKSLELLSNSASSYASKKSSPSDEDSSRKSS